MVLARRDFCAGALSVAGGIAGAMAVPAFARADTNDWVQQLSAIERKAPDGSQLGAYIYDIGQHRGFGWRAGQRFAMCSSFKLSLAAMVLQRIARGRLNPNERIRYHASDLLPNSPVTAAHLAEGMTVLALAEAAQTMSDNAAANLLLRKLGGPAALTKFWRTLGDTESRLDDIEPALNRVPEGEVRNTTSPRAMALTVAKLLAGGGIPHNASDRLLSWMHATETGDARIRAGLPREWWAGDKTGTGLPADAPGTIVDLAFVRPAQGAPFVVSAFLRTARPQEKVDPAVEAALAQVGALAARWAAERI
jgi:beta-lactamase class A